MFVLPGVVAVQVVVVDVGVQEPLSHVDDIGNEESREFREVRCVFPLESPCTAERSALRAAFLALFPCLRSCSSSRNAGRFVPASPLCRSAEEALSVVRDEDESSSPPALKPTAPSAEPRLFSESADMVLSPSIPWKLSPSRRGDPASDEEGESLSAAPLSSGVVGGVLSRTAADGSAPDGPASAASATEVKMSILEGPCCGGCCCCRCGGCCTCCG